ncbi:MAG: glycoside hydrolase family 127 protein [Clostridia bacterium]|nr:glycoside hydrolase family 127 protein [Clostridia bacterium]
MNYKIDYKVNNLMQLPSLGDCFLEGEIGARFDRFILERVSGKFALENVLREAEDFFATQYDDIYTFGYWRSEFWGKLMLSAVRCCQYNNDDVLKEDLRKSCYKMLSLQREDGYLSTYRNSDNIYPVDTAKSVFYSGWEANYCWNIWGIKYTLWALIEAAMYMDDQKILTGAVKLADWVVGKFAADGTRVKDSGVMDGMPSSSILKPMLVLYRITGDQKYLDFGKNIVKEWTREDNERPNLITNALSGEAVADWYGLSSKKLTEGHDLGADWVPKAYEMTSCFDGIIELYRITGDEVLLDAAKEFYEILLKYESNILGSVGYCERYQSAANYADSATEICDVLHWMRLCHELFRLTGEAKYMQSFEKAFVNAYIAGVYADGTNGAFFVRSAGRHFTALPQCETRYQHCCLNNVGRGFTNAAESCVTKNDKGYFVNMFTQSYTRFGDTDIRVGANYFDSGWVGIAVRNPEEGKKLYIRIPEWSKNTKIRVDLNDEVVVDVCGDYYEVNLNADTTIMKIRFDMSVEVINCEWFFMEDNDYHLHRWRDGVYGLCNKDCMLQNSKIVLRRGPVILARTKKFGALAEDMFSTDTLYGKNIECIVSPHLTNNTGTLVTTRVFITADGEKYEYIMCDFASAGNVDSSDPKLFSIYL